MKYNTCRVLLFILTFFLFLFARRAPVKAEVHEIPTIFGQVINKYDQMPVVGVWVKWEDRLHNIRFIQTDAQGKFVFESWWKVDGNKLKATDIDTDLDGVNDSKQAYGYGFGCSEGPHNWSVVKPNGWNGRFVNNQGIEAGITEGFANIPGQIDMGMMYWEPSCDCYSMDVVNADDLVPGREATFSAKARVNNPATNPARVTSMTYFIERNGIEITPSPGETREITVSGPEPTVVDGMPVNLYTTKWSFQIPKQGNGVEKYKVSVKLNCGITAAQAPDEKASLIKSLSGYITGLFNKSDLFQPKTVLSADQILSADKTIKIGTFYPPEVGKGCNQLWFKINYNQ